MSTTTSSVDDTTADATGDGEANEQHIYLLGLAVLFGWILVIILCAAPKSLFRDLIHRYICCWLCEEPKPTIVAREEKIAEARERLRRASESFLGGPMAARPSGILMHQVLGAATAATASDSLHAYRHGFVAETINEVSKEKSAPRMQKPQDVEYRSKPKLQDDDDEKAKAADVHGLVINMSTNRKDQDAASAWLPT